MRAIRMLVSYMSFFFSQTPRTVRLKLTHCYPAGSDMIRPIVAELGNNDTNNDHADSHDN